MSEFKKGLKDVEDEIKNPETESKKLRQKKNNIRIEALYV